MSDDGRNEVVCSDCGATPKLYETPYAETSYVVACDCDRRAIDVTPSVDSNMLLHPMSGKWSMIDHNHEHH